MVTQFCFGKSESNAFPNALVIFGLWNNYLLKMGLKAVEPNLILKAIWQLL